MSRLAGKVAVITGGGSGIGAATAKLFVEEGAQVLIVGRTESTLVDTVKDIGTEAIGYAIADTSQVEDTRRYVSEAVTRYGGIDVLVSNAGTEGRIAPATDLDVEDFDQVIATNVRGVWLSYKHAAPEIAKRGGGSVAVTASVAGTVGLPAAAAYCASKHGALGLVRALAQEGSRQSIRVNAVCPGLIENRMTDSVQAQYAPIFGVPGATEVRAMLQSRVPAGRYGTCEEIAKLHLFLASDDAGYVTGSAYVADGGVTAGVL